ncbi:MAG: DUF3592 domain-containing protein [Anaerolineae bacterium]
MSSNQLFALVFCLIAIGSSVPLIYNQILATKWGKHSESWPTAKGQITRSEVQKRSAGKNGVTYHPVIAYSYRIDGTWYEAKRVEFGKPLVLFNAKEYATNLVAKYPKGLKTAVYYHPDQPTLATLQPGISRRNLVFGWLSSLLPIVIGTVLAYLAITTFR